MKITRGVWIGLLILVVWLLLSWFLGSWLGSKPPALYYLRAGLWVLGLAGFIGYLILRPKQEELPQASADSPASEIDFHFNEARNRLRAAAAGNQPGTLPAVLLLGDSGSAKTTVIAKSGLEPELLAGQAYENVAVVPTRSVNLWYGRNTLFVDPGGAALADIGTRRRLFRKLQPVRASAVVQAKAPPTRSVVFTVDCDTFLQPGGAEALAAKARDYQKILSELASDLGSSFPVYVLFTKLDKIAYFRDYADTFTEGEAADILGVTLPFTSGEGQGVYSEQQARRVTEAFQSMYYALCDRRPVYLEREHDAAKLPNIYEFAREFAKLRPLLVQFLVDLCRPSQLASSPFLRGFYFTGVRPVSVPDLVPAAQAQVAEEAFDAGATRIFHSRSMPAQHPAEAREAGSRRVAQWVFLPHFFPDVVLADRPAAAITQRNVKVDFARRLLLCGAALIGLLLCIWLGISYANNSSLIKEATEAERGIPAGTQPMGQLASLDSLQRLTRMKNVLARIDKFDREGAPLSYRAFLYSGDAIRDPLRTAYYAAFRRLLLAPTQEALIGICSKPDAPGAAEGYGYVYDALKAYLITTNHHEQSNPEFLTPKLMQHWQQSQPADPARQDLAQQNFRFYGQELATANPYPKFAVPAGDAVDAARAYLNKLPPEERIYHAMLNAARGTQKPILFNADYPESRATIINMYSVDPAFTKQGYENFSRQMQNPDNYLKGEKWVLGEAAPVNFDKQTVLAAVRDHYDKDFIKTWTAYLNATSVVHYNDTKDAAKKLDMLSKTNSPLLQVLCIASENASANKDATSAFQPVESVTPPGCTAKLVQDANMPYMQSLINLQSTLQGLPPNADSDPNTASTVNANATDALKNVNTLALKFAPDSPVLTKTTNILRDPITNVQPLLKGLIGGAPNKAAQGLCDAIGPMLRKYPFNQKSPEDASLAEINNFLAPQSGQLWQLYNNSLKQYLTPTGTAYVATPGQQATVTRAFLGFFNRAVQMSQALYPNSAQQPTVAFAMQPVQTPDVDHITLAIDGQTLSTDPKTGSSQTFAWPGTSQSASLSVRFGGSVDFQISNQAGLWAVWRLLQSSETWQAAGSKYELMWIFRTSAGTQQIGATGHAPSVKFDLNPQGSPVFRPGFFSDLACVRQAVQ